MQFQSDLVQIFRVVFIMFMMSFFLIIVVIQILAFCKIFSKAGYSWALGLLMFVPIANIVMLFVLAFSEWPIERELRSFKQQNQVA